MTGSDGLLTEYVKEVLFGGWSAQSIGQWRQAWDEAFVQNLTFDPTPALMTTEVKRSQRCSLDNYNALVVELEMRRGLSVTTSLRDLKVSKLLTTLVLG